MNLGEWLSTWLSLYVDQSSLASNTKACYHRAVAAVPDELSVIELGELNALHILPWIQSVARTHPRAAQLDRVMLSKALRTAAKVGLCAPGIIDPETVPKPVYEAPRALILDLEGLHCYMDAAASTEVAPVLMLCCCGLRRGEALGLRWDAVDLAGGTVTIRGQRIGDQLVPLKTRHSSRRLQLPRQVVEILRAWPRSVSGWVCDVSVKTLYTVHRRILADHGLPPVTLHGLRHSFATASVMAGVPVKILQGALGHGHYAITADLYADHLPSVSDVPGRVYG